MKAYKPAVHWVLLCILPLLVTLESWPTDSNHKEQDRSSEILSSYRFHSNKLRTRHFIPNPLERESLIVKCRESAMPREVLVKKITHNLLLVQSLR